MLSTTKNSTPGTVVSYFLIFEDKFFGPFEPVTVIDKEVLADMSI